MTAHPKWDCMLSSASNPRTVANVDMRKQNSGQKGTTAVFGHCNMMHWQHKSDMLILTTCGIESVPWLIVLAYSCYTPSPACYVTTQTARYLSSVFRLFIASRRKVQHIVADQAYRCCSSANQLRLSEGMHSLGVPGPLPFDTHVLPHALQAKRDNMQHVLSGCSISICATCSVLSSSDCLPLHMLKLIRACTKANGALHRLPSEEQAATSCFEQC